jgi:hypothetical protein
MFSPKILYARVHCNVQESSPCPLDVFEQYFFH